MVTVLNSDSIDRIAQEIHSDLIYDITTIAYLQYLLLPYSEEIVQLTTRDDINNWIDQVLLNDVAKLAHNAANNPNHQTLSEVHNAVIDYLLGEILELSGNHVKDMNDIIVLPWDIQYSIGNDMILSKIFNIMATDNKLPAIITVRGLPFNHMVSLDLVTGLFLFCQVGGFHIDIEIFNVSLIDYYFIQKDTYLIRSRYLNNRFSLYSVEVNGYRFKFDSRDFMQGFTTGSLWFNVDPKLYWSNLLSYTRDSITGTVLSSSITF